MTRRPGTRALTHIAVAGAVVVSAAVLPITSPTAPAGAVGDGSASSRVTRDGRIITSILTGRPIRYRGSGRAPTTYWLTIGDAELSELLQLFSLRPDLVDAPVVRALRPAIEAGPNGDVEVQLEVTRGRLTGASRLVPIATTSPAQVLARRMITLLPSLPPTVSPPPATPVVIGEPVFFSFDDAAWSTRIDRSLTAGGVTARVRAWPVSFTVHGGDPADGRPVTCNGPGRAYDPASASSPGRQATASEACTVTYRSATGTSGRRDRWYGDVTVLWRAEWSTDGVNWASLGLVPRISVFGRSVREAETSIESTS